MGRSLSRFSLLIGSAIAGGSLLVGCASEVPGPAVIAAPAAAAAAQAPSAGDFLAGLEQAVASELSAIDSTQTDNEPPAVIVELDALSSESSLIEAENFGSLVTTGANQIAKRERLLNALIASVKGSPYLSGVAFNGTLLSTTILAVLNRFDGQVQGQAAAIENAALPDQLRAVILAIGPSTRLFGLVQPEIHLLLAAGDELNGVRLLQLQYALMYQRVDAHHEGSDIPTEQTLVLDLGAQIAQATRVANADINALLALTPAGYPGNKSVILSVRAQLTQLKSPLGPLNAGVGDVNELTTLLGARS
jgi:hypothetical protein